MMEFDDQALSAALDGVAEACDALPQIAAQVRAEALGHLILGARRNIYDTAPGAYQRTGELLRGLDARARSARDTAVITVSGSAPYHAYVELGTGAYAQTVAQAKALALASPDPAVPLSVGRSGVNYTLPGPIVAPAQVFALHRMSELFARRVQGALRVTAASPRRP